jgi:sulfite reductase alpha subunit-like flavoprotein
MMHIYVCGPKGLKRGAYNALTAIATIEGMD